MTATERIITELLNTLEYLNNIAGDMNRRQHAGVTLAPSDWSELYGASEKARAVIAKATNAV